MKKQERRLKVIFTYQKKAIRICLGLLVMSIVIASCAGGSDEQQIKNLLQRSMKAWNEKNYRALYEMQTPNVRERVSYEGFKNYTRGASGLIHLFFGKGKTEISDIEVRVRGGWGYASYKIRKDGEVIDSVDEDIFRKVKGKWYDVADNPMVPGYNKEDLPPEKR